MRLCWLILDYIGLSAVGQIPVPKLSPATEQLGVNMKRGIVLLLFAGTLAGCNSVTTGSLSSMSDQEAIALARKRVAESLKDPSSAQFGPHFDRKTQQLGVVFDRVCGTVNAKNSFGAYTGQQTFSYLLQNDRVVMGENALINCGID